MTNLFAVAVRSYCVSQSAACVVLAFMAFSAMVLVVGTRPSRAQAVQADVSDGFYGPQAAYFPAYAAPGYDPSTAAPPVAVQSSGTYAVGFPAAGAPNGPVSPLIGDLRETTTFSETIDAPPQGLIGETPVGPIGVGRTSDWFDCKFIARGYYLNDQRIQWSGLEATFGAEGVLAPVIRRCYGLHEVKVEGEFYLNEPLNRNVLVDTPERRSYASNYDIDTFEISQLNVSVRRRNLEVVVGKMVTPFGRYYFPLYSNARLDAPFLRTEAIRWRETGVLVRVDPGCFVGELAFTNGCDGLDTNSSKAVVSRLGLQGENSAIGCSVKMQDGVGSETQKQFNSHVGLDFMTRRGCFTFSCEAIYDEYGFRHPDLNPDDITWGRSIYYRDQFHELNTPITGAGFYCNLDFDRGPWAVTLNYGEFYPESIGDPRHDVTNRRGIGKVAYDITPFLETYLVAMAETEGYTAQAGRLRRGTVALVGLQYTF